MSKRVNNIRGKRNSYKGRRHRKNTPNSIRHNTEEEYKAAQPPRRSYEEVMQWRAKKGDREAIRKGFE